MTHRFFIDSNVLLLAVGGEHGLRNATRNLLAAATDGTIQLHAGVEAIQEFCFHRMRGTERRIALDQTRQVNALVHVHAFDQSVLDRTIQLIDTTPLRGRDVVHAATALEHGFSQIVTADLDFEGIPGLARVDPAAATW